VLFSSPGATFSNSGTVTGGNGGTAGTGGGGNGSAGAGGAGVYGAGLTVINSGSIAGGVSGDSTPVQAYAIQFTGGSNFLTTNGGNYTGGINISNASAGTLTLAQTAAAGATRSATYANVMSGSGAVIVSTDSNYTVTLSGANTYSGGTTLTSGTLVVGNNSALGSGALAMAAGTTLSFLNTGNFTIANNIVISGDPNFSPPSGTTQTVTGVISDGGTPGVVNMTGAGTLVLSGINTYSGGTTISSGTLQATNNSSVGSGTVTLNGGTFQAGAAGLSVANSFAINAAGGTIDTQGNTLTLSGAIANGNGSGALTVTGSASGGLILTGNLSYTGLTTVAGGSLVLGDATHAVTLPGNATLTGGNLAVSNGSLGSGTINNQGQAIVVGLVANQPATAGSAKIINAGTVSFQNSGSGGTASINNTGLVDFADTSTAASATIASTGGGLLQFRISSSAGNATITTGNGSSTTFADQSTGGTSRQIVNSGGLLDISLVTTPSFAVGSLEGAGNVFLGSNNLAVGGNNLSTTFSGVIQDGGVGGGTGASLTKTGSGTLTLSNVNSYTGATMINAGTLEVDGSIVSSSLVTVNAGGTLSGIGQLGATQISSAGTLAPGNAANPTGALAITGNLAFQSGALYLVQITPATAASVNVSGTATLTGATVNALFASGTYLSKQYTILTAAGGLNGTAFAGLTNTNLPAGFTDSLSYSGSNVFLNLTAKLGSIGAIGSGGLNTNQRNVANGLNNFFNSGGALPANFVNIFGLTGAGLGNALSALSGEDATGAERAAFQLTDEFLQLMLDPFVNGRANLGGAGSGGGSAIGFAPDEQQKLPDDIALAYAAVLGKAPAPAQPSGSGFDQRWGGWGAAYGGSNATSGDPSVGSHDVSAQTYGFAAGMDYHFAPHGVAGFALAGGGTNWGLSNALGSGSSQAFQFGGYSVEWFGRAYLAGALSFANHWFTTNRAALGDQLKANFIGQNYGARLEGGYRVPVWSTLGIAPYAAAQFQDFYTPGYREADVTGGGFGLSYAAMNATDVRTELGSRFDEPTLLAGTPLVLFGRLAWAHDFVSNPALSAAFQALPGSNFTVFGAPIPHDSALTTAGAQWFLTASWSLTAKFEGEFAAGSQTYAGTGTLRYTW
jgi:autotransporter-associated beta strand protein